MTIQWTHPSGCPRLFLAPMEGLADGHFRQAIALIGGFDEASTEFLRVPRNAHVKSLAKRYNPHETAPIPQACQLMGGDPDLLAEMTREVVARGAPRVDLNCGCPSNTVTGRGAGSSLLKEPRHLHDVAKAMVEASSVPVSAKLRSGFADTSLFRENLLAAQEAGVVHITLHPRTKVDGYGPPARWDLLAEAKMLLNIPLIGSGDVCSPADVRRMIAETGCDGVMIGRAAVANPWIFHETKAAFENTPFTTDWSQTEAFARHFAKLNESQRTRTQINKLKQLSRFLLAENEHLTALVRSRPDCPKEFLEDLLCLLRAKSVEKNAAIAYK